MIKFYSRLLTNKKYRYTCDYHGISVCVDSKYNKTENEIEEFLDNCSIDYLINNEGYIINIS